ncbi:zinc finger protein 768-like isoform X2 [Sardina pilchardus]|uniref:zinc finger protein 768-like isoform X2 n=1 Tax=Sardina pilchardus TaxID=27697 RepID=UPI002E115649
MTNVSPSRNLQSQLASIMELISKAAISEIIKLFDENYVALRLEISQNQNEKEALKRKLHEVQEELTCVRMRLETSLPLSNCPLPREHALQDWTSQGQAVTVGVNPEQPLISEHQSLEDDPHLVRIKEEGPIDEFWSQEAGPVRFDTTVAENSREHLQLSQEPVEFRELELKAEPQEVQVAQGDCTEDEQTQSGAEGSRWEPLAKEQEVCAREEVEHFLPFLPQVEQAFGYFHSNPISPEHQPEVTLTPPLSLVPRTSNAFSVSMGTDMAYVAPPLPRQGRGMARRPIVCPVCQKHLLAPSELTKHMRSHTGERPFACGICGVHFAQKSSLKTHERLHSGLRPYRCVHCGKDYTLSHHLKRHMRSHFRERGGASQPEMQLQGP